MPMGIPGCPEPARCTASMSRARIAEVSWVKTGGSKSLKVDIGSFLDAWKSEQKATACRNLACTAARKNEPTKAAQKGKRRRRKSLLPQSRRLGRSFGVWQHQG